MWAPRAPPQPSTVLLRPGEDRYIEVGFNPPYETSSAWPGSPILDAYCTRADVVLLWSHLQMTHPRIWLVNNYDHLHTPESFLAAPAEEFR